MSPAALGARSETDRTKGIRVKLYVVKAWMLAAACMMALTNESSFAREETKSQPMRFEWRTQGTAKECGQHCRTWISATGVITESTVREFELFASSFDLRGATLVLDSEGGSVLATLEIGHLIRRLGMTTSIGKTKILPSFDETTPRATLSPKARCESMCAFLLLAGTRRYVPPEARVLVHQIWLGSKSKHALEASYTAEEFRIVQRDIGRLARYTIEMGGDIQLIETALRVPPWEPLYELSTDELRDMRIVTVDQLFESDIPTAAAIPVATSSVSTTSGQTQRRND
jgi:hypothetical protein